MPKNSYTDVKSVTKGIVIDLQDIYQYSNAFGRIGVENATQEEMEDFVEGFFEEDQG